MKRIYFFNIKLVAVIFAMVALTSSCKKVLDVNTDPNNPATATSDLILPAAQTELGLTVGNTWNFVGSMWAQYWTGGYGVSTSNLEYYNMSTADVDGAWTRAYARTLADLDAITKKDEVIYSGIAKIMSAYLYQMLVDLHGDIPFSEALKGSIEDGNILTPKFDSETFVYSKLIPLIDSGLTLIAKKGQINPSTGFAYLVPSSNDLFYAGDLNKWAIFANTLKLKILVRQNKFAEAKALIETPGVSFINSSANECKITYSQTTRNTNPLYARFISRTNVGMYYVATSASVTTLQNLSDPRLNKLYLSGTGGIGVDAGDINDNTTSYPSGGVNTRFFRPSTSQVFTATTPVYFISSWESEFLQSEVYARLSLDAEATSHFESAVTLSCLNLGVSSIDASNYIATLGFSGADAETQVDKIAIQKWISMNGFQMAEGWLETLRFDRTNHRMFTGAGAVGLYTSPINSVLGADKYPTSFVYPTQETSLNPNTPANRRVTDKRFWDVD
ncbi:MAG: SusD/RagB family nutrient-binding outer membrane lipoprotein [Chitinophagales bacterium]|jgi:hypothetical protein|nr:SusD/RagB family nutrient-binding outer membrane lipoprotein [Bacteroidota bacterium]